MQKRTSMTKLEALILLIAGLLMGTVFTFGVQYANAPIAREDAIRTTAVFSSYAEQKNRGHVNEIILRFEDHEQLYIDGACTGEELRDSIQAFSPGTELSMLVHPNSNTILELRSGGSVWLEFEDSTEKLSGEAKGFLVLGLVCYALAACGLLRLLIWKEQ